MSQQYSESEQDRELMSKIVRHPPMPHMADHEKQLLIDNPHLLATVFTTFSRLFPSMVCAPKLIPKGAMIEVRDGVPQDLGPTLRFETDVRNLHFVAVPTDTNSQNLFEYAKQLDGFRGLSDGSVLAKNWYVFDQKVLPGKKIVLAGTLLSRRVSERKHVDFLLCLERGQAREWVLKEHSLGGTSWGNGDFVFACDGTKSE